MGFILHIYIIFGVNLLTGGPTRIVVFLPISVFRRKKNIKRSPNGMKPSGAIFSEQTQPKRLGLDVKLQTRRPRGCPACPKGVGTPPTLVGPSLLHRRTSSSYIYIHIPANIQEHKETLFPPPQPSVSARSHLGAFVGAPPEGESTMEGLYIISKASPMSCE